MALANIPKIKIRWDILVICVMTAGVILITPFLLQPEMTSARTL